ncbi:MAG: hypothetical protein GC152_00825 [Alphaproteobacteria bacterium]|nr:hypothetical protein [Alphaproteobacteria bacterium]
MLQMFPLLAVSLVIYAGLTFVTGAAPDEAVWHQALLMNLPLPSGDTWSVRGGDFFLVVSIGFLFVELVRATRTDASSITNHIFSIILAVVNVLAFILIDGFGNSTFFIYMSMTFLDALAGMVVTTTTARRDFSVADGARLG